MHGPLLLVLWASLEQSSVTYNIDCVWLLANAVRVMCETHWFHLGLSGIHVYVCVVHLCVISLFCKWYFSAFFSCCNVMIHLSLHSLQYLIRSCFSTVENNQKLNQIQMESQNCNFTPLKCLLDFLFQNSIN